MNTFGRVFRFTTWGESHGKAIGVVIDGCPAGLALDLAGIQAALDRRRPGQSRITTQRQEADVFELLSGTVEGITTGAPLAFTVQNTDPRSRDYENIETAFRPSHADYTYTAKYGLRDHRGGGRSSARETVGRVIAGAVAQQILATRGVQIQAWVHSIGEVDGPDWPETVHFPTEHEEMVRCPDAAAADAMVAAILAARKAGDSLGGVVACRVRGAAPGWGDPVYGKLDALLASAMLSINAAKGFENGMGFAGARRKGSEMNDAFYAAAGRIRTRSNHSGGIQGGISNGEDICFRVAFKPTSTLMQDQETVDADGNAAILKAKGRHDPCVVPRAVPVVEAMAAVVLADCFLLHRLSRL